MPDYSNPNTKLTASKYSWDVTFQLGPVRNGRVITQDVTDGAYDTQPGDTVEVLLGKLVTWFAKTQGHPKSDLTIVRYSLREK